MIVVDKPALIATMGSRRNERSLCDDVKAYLKRKFHKPGNVYVGVVSRLDSFTSGVIVFARTSKAAARLTQQFKQGSVQKRYLAILENAPPAPAGELENWIIKNDRLRKMALSTSKEPGAKMARLSYLTLGRRDRQTLIQVSLLTGRKHQIRIQFAILGSPIVGDRKYGAVSKFQHGIALFSHSISFEHPVQKKRMTFSADVPKYWKIERFGVKSEDLATQNPGNTVF